MASMHCDRRWIPLQMHCSLRLSGPYDSKRGGRMTAIRTIAASILIFAGSAAVKAQQTGLICTSGGVNYQVGDIACIPACHGRERLARCIVSNGAASWSTISESCPSAMAPVLPWVGSLASVPSLRVPIADRRAIIGIPGGDAPLSDEAGPRPVQSLTLRRSEFSVDSPDISTAALQQ